MVRSAAGAVNALAMRPGSVHLRFHQSREIARMKHVTRLFAGAIETDEAQRLTPRVGVNPIRENSLIGRPELPAPASTPQRLIQTGKSKASPYSIASVSAASFVLPYKEMGARVEKSTPMPLGRYTRR